jgi:hypothetical protein
LSKYVAFIVDEYVKTKKPAPEPSPQRPLTPEQEIDKIGEEMGRLNEQYDEKFEAIRSLIPREFPVVQTDDDLKQQTKVVWKVLLDRNCFVRGARNKAVAISKEDVGCYERLGTLHLKKMELTKNLTLQM